jgi:hypothetical protein
MARHRNPAPSYVLHQQSGRARLIWTDTGDVRHEKLLPGAYGSDESLAAKARLELELATSPTRRVMKWAASEELIPVTIYQSLCTLAGLRRGRTEARESEPVKPVADDVVKATLPHLPHHVRVMVELITHTGMRPS